MRIQTMDIVTLKNGNKYFYIIHPLFGEILINNSGHLSFADYDEDFRVKRDIYNYPWDKPLDVCKIERSCNPNGILNIDNKATITVWSCEKDVKLPKDIQNFLQEYPTVESWKNKKTQIIRKELNL